MQHPDEPVALAWKAMRDEGFEPALSDAAQAEVARLADLLARGADPVSCAAAEPGIVDLRARPWSSIDHAETQDLDQIEMAEHLPGGGIRLRIAIADVDALVPKGSAIDRHAAHASTSVYTGIATFPMLPPELAHAATSLHEGQDRLAVVFDLEVDTEGGVRARGATRALVRNRTRLDYDEVAPWLDGEGPPPRAMAADAAMQAQVTLQAEAARRLQGRRRREGALQFHVPEVRAVVEHGQVVGLRSVVQDTARSLIEALMVAANTAMAHWLERSGQPSIRRVVHAPERWPRLRELAGRLDGNLPERPDAKALSLFLEARRAAHPAGFAELSLAVVKLIGSGVYTVGPAGLSPERLGHFGLALDDYTHATAPNRRYVDLVVQRLVKATLVRAAAGQLVAAAAGQTVADPGATSTVTGHAPGDPPYDEAQLTAIAARCTEREDAARKVERRMGKVAAAHLLSGRIGEVFDALVTGVRAKGTFARLLEPPADVRVVVGEAGLDVGDPVRLRLVGFDVAKGFLDFARVDGPA